MCQVRGQGWKITSIDAKLVKPWRGKKRFTLEEKTWLESHNISNSYSQDMLLEAEVSLRVGGKGALPNLETFSLENWVQTFGYFGPVFLPCGNNCFLIWEIKNNGDNALKGQRSSEPTNTEKPKNMVASITYIKTGNGPHSAKASMTTVSLRCWAAPVVYIQVLLYCSPGCKSAMDLAK